MSYDLIRSIFFPSFARRRDDAIDHRHRFAYYTTAATASLILSKQELWLRSTGVMNDHSEVEHGAESVFRSLSTDVGEKFLSTIEACHPGASKSVTDRLRDWLPAILGDTFISCLSEHGAEDDQYGRLSMWRAYGGDTGVAIVFKQEPFLSSQINIGAYTYPVIYGNATSVLCEIHEITNNISVNKSIVSALPESQFVEFLFQSLRACAIATKHKAFLEEKEWRIVACPSLFTSPYLTQEVRSIGAVSQLVQVLDIGAAAKGGIRALEPNNLIDRILIGPTQYQHVLHRSMVEDLRRVGVQNPHEKVHITDVPLRSNQR